MANPMMTGNFSELLGEGLQEIYFNTLKDYSLVYDKIAKVLPAKKLVEPDLGMTGFPFWATKDENTDIAYTDVVKGRSRNYTQVVRASGFKITWEMMKFELYNTIAQLPAQLAFSGWQTVDYIFSLMFLRANNSSYLGSDGVVWSSASHPYLRGGTGSNRLATFASLSRANVQSALNIATLWTNDAGIPKYATPKTLQIHPNNLLLAKEIVNSPERPDTASRAINALYNELGIVANPHLGTEDWNIIFNDQAVRLIKHFWAEKPGTLRKSQSEKNRDLYYDDIMSFATGFSGWQDVVFGNIA